MDGASRQAQRQQYLLLGIIAFVMSWDLWAIATDQKLSGSDTFVGYTLRLWWDIRHGLFLEWLRGLGPKGPLAPMLSLPFMLLVGQVPLAMRLVTVMCHIILMLQGYQLGRRITGRPGAGVWAALLIGVHPVMFGICRIAFHDAVLAVLLLAAVQLFFVVKLDRLRPALLLGVVVGLGLLVKLSYVVYIIAPAAWFMICRLRTLRSVGLLAVVGGAAALVALPWLVPNLQGVVDNIALTSHHAAQVSLSQRFDYYFYLPGYTPLLGAALAAVPLVFRHVARRDLLLLLTALPMHVVIFTTPNWSRYLVPILPLLSVLAGAGLDRLAVRIPGKPRVIVSALAGVCMLGLFAGLNLRGLSRGARREVNLGIIKPDQRRYAAFTRVTRALRPFGEEVLVAHDSMQAIVETEDLLRIWQHRGSAVNPISLTRARELIARGRPVPVLLIKRFNPPIDSARNRTFWPPREPGDDQMEQANHPARWLAKSPRRRRLLTAQDPDWMWFVAYVVDPPPAAGERRPPGDHGM